MFFLHTAKQTRKSEKSILKSSHASRSRMQHRAPSKIHTSHFYLPLSLHPVRSALLLQLHRLSSVDAILLKMVSTHVVNGSEPEWLSTLTPTNASCIRRLLSASAPPSFSHVPKRKQAAVAAILYQPNPTASSPNPELRVIMSTRALHLRSHPGQASLPGGKVDAAADRGAVGKRPWRRLDALAQRPG